MCNNSLINYHGLPGIISTAEVPMLSHNAGGGSPQQPLQSAWLRLAEGLICCLSLVLPGLRRLLLLPLLWLPLQLRGKQTSSFVSTVRPALCMGCFTVAHHDLCTAGQLPKRPQHAGGIFPLIAVVDEPVLHVPAAPDCCRALPAYLQCLSVLQQPDYAVTKTCRAQHFDFYLCTE